MPGVYADLHASLAGPVAVTPGPRTQALRERRGLLLAFAAFGLFWGSWSAVLPDVRERSGLGDGQLGLVLGAVAVAALPAMPLAGRLVDRYGPRRLLPAALLAFAGVGLLLGAAAAPAVLVGCLLLLGATTGVLDVVVNTATAAWERIEAGRLMTYGHGCFSVGVLAGAVTTGVARDLGAGPPLVLGVTGLLVASAGLAQPAYRRWRRGPAGGGAWGSAPRRRLAPVLLGLGAVVAASFLVEDAVQSWSALHLERSLGAPPWLSGLGPGLFALAMAVGRLGAHVLVPAGREASAVGAGALLTAVGVLVLAAAPVAAVAVAGAALAGAGISVLAAAAALGGRRAQRARTAGRRPGRGHRVRLHRLRGRAAAGRRAQRGAVPAGRAGAARGAGAGRGSRRSGTAAHAGARGGARRRGLTGAGGGRGSGGGGRFGGSGLRGQALGCRRGRLWRSALASGSAPPQLISGLPGRDRLWRSVRSPPARRRHS